MNSIKNTLLRKAGFVYFRGKWIPRLPGKVVLRIMAAKLALCNDREVNRMLGEFAAALYVHDIANDK